jgi:hypothetical protein
MTPSRNATAWKIATGALALFLACAGAMWSMVSVHAEHPHEDSTPRGEFEIFKSGCEGRLRRIEDKVDLLLERDR